MTKDILNLTKKIMRLTDDNDTNLTKVFIAYKVILYCNNNDIGFDNEKLMEIVNNVYEYIVDNNDSDDYDKVIESLI